MSNLRYRAFRTYQRLPAGVKGLLGNLFRRLPMRLRFGPDFGRVYRFLQESQYWDRERLAQYQLEQLGETLIRARQHVPYYRRRLADLDINPEKIDSLDIIKRFPLIDKAETVKCCGEMTATNAGSGRRFKAHTSACVGPYLEIPRTAYAHIIERAYLLLIWNWSGYQLNEPAIRLRAVDDIGQFQTYDGAQNCVEFTPTAFTDDVCKAIAAKARSFRPKALFGYPSYLTALAEAVVRLNRQADFASVKVCFCASEKLFAGQRRLINTAFDATVSQWYGMAEQVGLAGWCPECECLHEISQYSLVEYHAQGQDSSGLHQIVGTSFLNRAFPLVRYRMNDLVELSTTPNRCGRSYPSIKEVQGRAGDFLVTPSGALVSPTSLEFAWDMIPGIDKLQIHQERETAIHVLVKSNAEYGRETAEQLNTRLGQRIGEKMQITVELVDDIPQTKVKSRMIISKIGQNRLSILPEQSGQSDHRNTSDNPNAQGRDQ